MKAEVFEVSGGEPIEIETLHARYISSAFTKAQIYSAGGAYIVFHVCAPAVADTKGNVGATSVNLSRPRVQRLSPFFSLTSWKEDYNSFLFNNILASPQTDIFSPSVFNNIVELTFILGPPFFRHPGHPRID